MMLFLGMFPRLNHGRLKLMALSQAHAATFSDEDGDNPGDPDDPENPDPCDGGSSYPTTTSTISGNITTLTTCSYNYDGCGNYIGYSCDGGVQCGISSAGISLSETSGNIGDDVVLTASATVVGSPVIQYEFQQSSDGVTWDDVGNNPSINTFTYTLDEYGTNEFRVIESCDCSVSVTSSYASVIISDQNSCDQNNMPSYSLGQTSPSIPIGDNFGLTYPESLSIQITACNDGTNWHAVPINVAANYSQQIQLPSGISEVTGISGNTTQVDFCAQVTSLTDWSTWGYSGTGAWYMIEAVQAHENVHLSHFLPCLILALPSIKSDLYNDLVVPNTGQTSDQATAQLLALQNYTSVINSTAYNDWRTQLDPVVTADHGPGSLTETAEKNIVNPEISIICNYAHQQTWPVCTDCP